MQTKVFTSSLLIALFLCSTFLNVEPPEILQEASPISKSNVVDRVVVSSDTMTMTADEIIQFSATLYTTTNTTIQDEVNWSSSNGTISSDGIFYPWTAGVVLIEADYGGVSGQFNITVTPGAATSISIVTSTASVLEQNQLQAQVSDGRGNVKPASAQTVWDIDGEYVGTGSPVWTPEETGVFSIRARLYQLETNSNITVIAGSPHSFVFPDYMTVIAGQTFTLNPQLLDINDYSMPLTSAGSLSWWAERGTINEYGNYSSTDTGLWNITVTAGNVTGAGQIHVVPGSAVVSQVMIVDQREVYVAGQAYEVAVERRDINGYIGLVTPELPYWSVTSGGLSLDENKVMWTPSRTGLATVSTIDDGIPSSLQVEVVHGNAIEVSIRTSHASPHAGDQVVLETIAVDIKGNVWVVSGILDFVKGNTNELTAYESYTLLQAASTGEWKIEGTWFDDSTNSEFLASLEFDVSAGRLAFIALEGDGHILPADQTFDLNPQFYDAYGNQLDSLNLNWSIDGQDATLQMRLNDNVWSSSVLGGHEIRVNADGIFGTVRLNVVPGAAHSLLTDAEEGLVVFAGKPVDIYVEVVDIHGNVGESSLLTSSIDSSIGELEASSTGVGYWSFVGKVSGEYDLQLIEGNATHTIPLTVLPGEPIRIRTSMQSTSISQGDIILIDVWGVDAFDNIVAIDHQNTTITCTAGDAVHVTSGTWEIEVSESGNDRSCTILWQGLLAQNFFDVDEVLFGGAVGSTNTAIAILTFLLLLILVVMIVLVRKASAVSLEEWVEDVFEEDHATNDEEGPAPSPPVQTPVVSSQPESKANHVAGPKPELEITVRDDLARRAVEVGVMQAAPGTEQGKTGWYVNTKSGLEAWEVTAEGAWNKLE
jgi:hypothetical protein